MPNYKSINGKWVPDVPTTSAPEPEVEVEIEEVDLQAAIDEVEEETPSSDEEEKQ